MPPYSSDVEDIDLVESWPPYNEAAAREVIAMMQRSETSYYGREGWVARLEDAFREYYNVPYALATSSGTAALHSAYTGLRLGPGDEVICPTLTYLATVMPVFHANAIPVLVDCDADTGQIDVEAVAQAITSKTRAIVVTHNWGHCGDVDRLLSIAADAGLAVVEDCSHAHGARYRDRLVGTLGDVGVFSLQGRKLIAAGQGGMLITRDREIYDRAVLLGHFRVRAQQEVQGPGAVFARTGYGLNYRMHPFAAAYGWHQFQRMDEYIARRGRNANAVTDALSGSRHWRPHETADTTTRVSWYNYKVSPRDEGLLARIGSLDRLCGHPAASELSIRRPSNPPLHLEAAFQSSSFALRAGECPHRCPLGNDFRPYGPGAFPAAERFHERTFNFTVFTMVDVAAVAGRLVERLDDLTEMLLAAPDSRGGEHDGRAPTRGSDG